MLIRNSQSYAATRSLAMTTLVSGRLAQPFFAAQVNVKGLDDERSRRTTILLLNLPLHDKGPHRLWLRIFSARLVSTSGTFRTLFLGSAPRNLFDLLELVAILTFLCTFKPSTTDCVNPARLQRNFYAPFCRKELA